jgi:hypothetical protein
MANILSLALKVTADATGLKLDPVQRALVGLGEQADKLTAQFDQFAAGSGAAAAAQAEFAARSQELINTLRDTGGATQFAAAFEKLNSEARELAAVFAEGQRVTEANRTEEEKRAIALDNLNKLVNAGAISQETFNRASAEASGANAEAARAAAEAAQQQAEATRVQSEALRERQALESRAAAIINSNLTAQERYEQSLRELNDLQQQGLLTQDQYNRAVAAARKPLDDAAAASSSVAEAAKESTLQFNELSGVFAILPGSIGDIAGRLSGLSSAGEGLSRVFSGGLTQGITSVGQSISALVNPFTIAAAGIVGFGAAATAITRGLVDLEARVKSLGAVSDQIGVSFGFVQVLEEASSRAGTSLEATAAGLQKFAARVDDARTGTGAAAEAFRELGISQEELANTAPTELAGRVAEALGKIEDPARRSALQVDLLGKSGEALRRTFAELPGAAVDLAKFGAAISDEDRARIEALGPAFDGFGVALRGLGQSVLTPFAGLVAGLTATLGSLINVVTAVAQAIGAVLTPVLDAIGFAFSVVADGINNTVNFFRSFFDSAGEAAGATAELRGELEDLTEEESKQAAERDKFLQGFTQNVSKAIDESAKFGQAGFDAALQYQNAIADLQTRLDNGLINEEVFRREAAAAEEAFNSQLDIAKKAAAAIEANTKRVDELLGKRNEISQAERDINAVASDIARTQSEIEAARARGATEEANRLAARLAQLDQLQQSLIDRSDEAAQGFADGFDAAFEDIDGGINDLIDKASEFGNEGAIAASQLTEGIEQAKEAVRDGILNEQAFQAEVDRQKELFEDRVSGLQEAAKITEQAYEKEAALLDKQFEIEKQRAEELASIRTGSIQIDDFREGGVDQFFDTLREDPAIGEARKQTKELEKIRQEIAKLNAQRVDILAGVG